MVSSSVEIDCDGEEQLQGSQKAYIPLLFWSICIGTLALVPVCSFDLWWHMAYGRSMWQSFSWPTVDLYSWSHAGRAVDHIAWLPGLIFYGAWSAGGLTALVVLKGVAFSVWAFISLLYARFQRVQPWYWWLISIVCILLLYPRFGLLRSYYAFYICFPVLVWLWDAYERSRQHWVGFSIPILFIVWANAHASFPVGLLWLGLVLIWPSIWEKERRVTQWMQAVWMLVACVAATFITPTGWGTWKAILSILTQGGSFENYRATLETMPMQLSEFGTRALPAAILVLLALPAFSGLSWKRHGARFVHWIVLLLFVFQKKRYVGIFAVSSLLFLPYWWTLLQKESSCTTRTRWSWKTLKWMAVLLFLVLVVRWGWLTFSTPTRMWPRPFSGQIQKDIFPIRSAHYLEKYRPQGRLYNVTSHGSYLVWAAPHTPVSIDGRLNLLYRDAFWRKQIGDFIYRKKPFPSFLSSHKMVIALVPYSPMSRQLSKAQDWFPVAYDNQSILYLKKGYSAHNDHLIQKTGYRWLRFDRMGPMSVMVRRWQHLKRTKPKAFELLQKELRRAISEMPKKPLHLTRMLQFLQQLQ